MDPPRPRYMLVLEALPDPGPPVERLRMLLKTALRRYALKCVDLKEWKEEPPCPNAHPAAPPSGGVVMAGSGKRMPLDAEPHPDGNVRILPSQEGEVLSKADLEHQRQQEDLGGPHTRLYRSHFAAWAHVAQHRRRP